MHVHVTVDVARPSAGVWDRLQDLSALEKWAPDVTSSPSDPLAVGAVRRAQLAKPAFGKAVLVERVTDVGDQQFTYEIEGGIGPLTNVETTWSVRASGRDAATVSVHSDVTLAPWARLLTAVVRWQWRRQMQALADGFAAYAVEA